MLSIKEIQKIDYEMVKEFVKICKKYKFKYYIIGGTLLGAIRHQGFIPWDDDMDIAMPREDFEQFLVCASKELPNNLELITFKNNKKYRYYLPRIINKKYEIVEKRYEKLNEKSNIFIDIFPIDGSPNNIFLRKIFYLKIMFYRMLVSMYYIDTIEPDKKRNFLDKILIKIAKIIPIKKMVKPKKVLTKIDNLLKKNKFENSKYVGTIMGAYRIREMVPKEYFGKPQKYKFEDTLLYGPEKYHQYLTHIYGNYQEIPKVKQTHYLKGDKNEDKYNSTNI